MANEELMLNITDSSAPAFHTGKKKFSKPLKAVNSWAQPKVVKRKFEGSDEGPPIKCKAEGLRPLAKDSAWPKERSLSKKSQKSPAKRSVKKQGRDEEEQPFIKTSSLFKNNPEIPQIHRPAVKQLREKVFTSGSFSELDIHPHLVSTLNSVLNISSMTSVQKQTIPTLLDGKDAMVKSQTGSGKTLAYGIPLVQILQKIKPKIQRSDGPYAVIVVPTRELALQSFETLQKLLKPFTWIVPGVLMGGEKRKSEKARLRKGINILISTPGRLVDHIKNTKSIHFGCVRWLVLDEADRILDLGFEKDITVILNALNAACKSRQTVFLSATLTEGVTRLAGVSLTDPVNIYVAEEAQSGPVLEKRDGEAAGAPAGAESESFVIPEKLKQHVVIVPSKLRLTTLGAFILAKCKFEKGQKLIVFFSSCESVEFHHTLFTKVLSEKAMGREEPTQTASSPSPITFLRLHGNMEQQERTEVFLQFIQSKSGVLLCTDVAARGLDLPQVTWIVQYNAPSSPAEYVHRIGRTARIGSHGSSLLFLTPSEAQYMGLLASHKISVTELKMEDILCNLMMDERLRGRNWGKKKSHDALLQEVKVRATVLQTEFENHVHSSEENVFSAKKDQVQVGSQEAKKGWLRLCAQSTQVGSGLVCLGSRKIKSEEKLKLGRSRSELCSQCHHHYVSMEKIFLTNNK
ncbi:probable ATP-dependent RNA helicase DDX31 isoform X2 [Latimeria chalumnae]|uniref:probable ATP-dependent RNA helicase DDX31 isoform X2 n=1 Tax=Latimeria chalumnae TaxID=7897 RepID=UPI00313CEB77